MGTNARGPKSDVKGNDVGKVVETVREKGEGVVMEGDDELDDTVPEREDGHGPDAELLAERVFLCGPLLLVVVLLVLLVVLHASKQK